MTDATPYTELPGFGDLLLEESYVLDVVAHPAVVTIRADLVLTAEHPEYRSPADQEPYCWRRGTITLPGVSALTWTGQGTPPSTDASGTIDYGNIDELVRTGETTRIEGDFGTITVEGSEPQVQLDPGPAPSEG
ncbi:hypothetical protein [Actinocatenispora rupis]|uniref:Uncharacterized protein n=1 Tax=Actinocatenispora rupis TaxID=519421 RepID=A0A8J3NFI4_9ACTN|nr:hypothetical protein [Actinocatenispora rupis]GID14915.1 hypothetical protein Aru02nite_58040 [Actinocatenispora rupis]